MSARSARAAARSFPVQKAILWASVALVAVGVLVAIGLANRSVPPTVASAPPLATLSVGDPAPAFSIATTHGGFALASVHRPVLLEVFATWCPHCQHETRTLNALYDRYHRSIDFLAVSGSPYAIDRNSPESLPDVLAFGEYFGVRYPLAFDPSLEVAQRYLQGGYPTLVLIGTGKRVAYVGSGEISESVLEAQIRRSIAK